MSETVMYKGKLKNLYIAPEEFLKQQGKDLESMLQEYGTYTSAVNFEFYQKFYATEFTVFRVELDTNVDEYSDIFQSRQNGKDIYFFLCIRQVKFTISHINMLTVCSHDNIVIKKNFKFSIIFQCFNKIVQIFHFSINYIFIISAFYFYLLFHYSVHLHIYKN